MILIMKKNLNEKNSVGFRLKEVRKQLNMNQARFGEFIGYSAETISRYENDRLAVPESIIDVLFEKGINGFAVFYGKDQKDDFGETYILKSEKENAPVAIDGYLIDTPHYEFKVEKSSVVSRVNSCFVYLNEDFDEIKTGDVLYLQSEFEPRTGDLVVEYSIDSGCAIFKLQQLTIPITREKSTKEEEEEDDLFLLRNNHESFVMKRKELKEYKPLAGRIEYFLRHLDKEKDK